MVKRVDFLIKLILGNYDSKVNKRQYHMTEDILLMPTFNLSVIMTGADVKWTVAILLDHFVVVSGPHPGD